MALVMLLTVKCLLCGKYMHTILHMFCNLSISIQTFKQALQLIQTYVRKQPVNSIGIDLCAIFSCSES